MPFGTAAPRGIKLPLFARFTAPFRLRSYLQPSSEYDMPLQVERSATLCPWDYFESQKMIFPCRRQLRRRQSSESEAEQWSPWVE